MSEHCLLFEISSHARPADISIIEESYNKETKTNKVVFKTKLQTADEVNQNNRIYNKDVCKAIVEDLKPKAIGRSLFQEIDHPFIENPDAQKRRASFIQLSNCGSLIRDIYVDGPNIIGVVETLSGFRGPDLYNIIAHDKADIGFSVRMFGKVRPHNTLPNVNEVSIPLKAITYDVVTTPSHKSAKIIEFLTENINEFNDGDSLLTESSNEFLLMENANKPTSSNEIINSYLKLVLEEAFDSIRPITFKI